METLIRDIKAEIKRYKRFLAETNNAIQVLRVENETLAAEMTIAVSLMTISIKNIEAALGRYSKPSDLAGGGGRTHAKCLIPEQS
jgi:uncharacterized protein YaaN involved in tellurite resistance